MFRRIRPIQIYRNFSKSRSVRNIEKAKPAPNEESLNTQNMNPTYAPKEWEKKILIWSGKYKTYDEIPRRISYEVLENAKSKMRIRTSNVMMVGTLILCAFFAYRGKQRSKQGDTINKRRMMEDERIKAQAKAG